MIKDMVFVSPETEGLESRKVMDFMALMEYWKVNLHSFMVVRRGKILAEAYAKPFDKDFKHRIYSCSKTYVALAVGKLIKEKRVKLEDKLYTYFIDSIGERELHPYLKEVTIEDALTMTVPLELDSYANKTPTGWTFKTTAWADTFFDGTTDCIKPAGILFRYNTSAPFTLDVLVERLTGMTFLEYLAPEFAEIGITDKLFCVQSPDGYSWGGSGVLTTMRDYAKVAELLLLKGTVNGKELLPKEYMEKATSKRIDNVFDNGYGCSTLGYGYQLWMHPNGFAMHGMGSQFAFIFPDKEFMVICFADTQCSRPLYNDKIFFGADMLYKSLRDEPLQEGQTTHELKEALENFALVNGYGAAHSSIEKEIDGVRFVLDQNPMGLKWLEFSFEKEEGKLIYENERGVKKISFGLEKYVESTFPETHYWDKRIGTPSDRELRSIASAAFTSENRILIRLNIIDVCLGHLGIVVEFKEDRCAVQMQKAAEGFLNEYQGVAIGRRV